MNAVFRRRPFAAGYPRTSAALCVLHVLRVISVISVISATVTPAFADTLSPVGVWRIVDETGDPKALIVISERDGEYVGALAKSLGRRDALERRCDGCTDDRKGRKLQGMEIIRGLRKDGDEYTGGKILDPDSGSEYGCKIRVVDGGKKLEVRGYFGISLLGRTQTWIREP
ncbi:signal peptide protein [Pandoraea morbifera]|uniref:Signal peptide protein n=1 Tax=Pandoraea morbifera TaxID=2508300 RepID=A0A5E4S8Q4_9BURK|nr:signal peptide protein [Pandoraea morbifera]